MTRNDLEIALFGHPRFSAGGVPFRIHCRPRTIVLLAFLLLHRDAYLTRDVLAFTLWPDESESQARANLRRHLHDLSAALPAAASPYVLAVNDTLVWNDAAAVRVDVWEFERLAADEATCSEAVDLYQGDLLPTVFDDWIFPIRERLRSRFIGLAEKLVVRARQQREFATAAAYAQRILADDPWREDTLRGLASIRYEAGDRAGALHEIDAFIARLSVEMETVPMPETVVLRNLIVRGIEPADAAAAAADESARAPSLPFVGREPELGILLAAWKRAARHRGQLVFLGGEPGAGKTRLAHEFAAVASSQGGRVLRGGTSAPESIPYQALVEALRDAAPLMASLAIRPIWLSALATLLPELSLARDDVGPLPPLESKRESSRLYEAIAAVVQALARPRPLVLILEDLHWAAGSTIGALEYLARRIGGMPALVIATYRSGELGFDHSLAVARRQLLVENVAGNLTLSGISQSAVLELARATPALAAATDEFAGRVHAATQGNPLFVGELLRDITETGAHEAAARGLRSTLESRFGRLSEPALMVAEIGSVAGATFDVDLVSEVTGSDEAMVLEAIAELLDRRLVREVGRSQFCLAFTHQVIAAQLYERIAPERKRRFHRRVAAVLERLSPEGSAAATLALHYERAGSERLAAGWHLAAARRAFAVFANTEAVDHATRGLELTHEQKLRLELLAVREQTFARIGDRTAQSADLEALDSLAAELDDSEARANVLLHRALLAHARGEHPLEVELLAALSQQAQACGSPAHEALALRETAKMLHEEGRYAAAAAAAQEALRRYRGADDVWGEVETLCLLGEIAVNHGSANTSELLEQARERARASGNAVLEARIAMAAAQAAIMRRDFAAALEASNEALQSYLEIGDREGEGEARARVATTSSMLLDFEESRKEAALAADIFVALGSRRRLAYVYFNRSALELNVGILDAASGSATAALRIFDALGDARGQASCLNNLSMIRLHQGAAAEARALAEQALERARAIGNRLIEAAILSNLGNAERVLGDHREALDHMHEAFAIREELGLLPEIEELADVALTQLESGDRAALRTCEGLLERARGAGKNTVWPYYCYWAAARVFHRFGDRRAADALATAADLVSKQSLLIANPEWRAGFAALPMVREIRAACERGEWP